MGVHGWTAIEGLHGRTVIVGVSGRTDTAEIHSSSDMWGYIYDTEGGHGRLL